MTDDRIVTEADAVTKLSHQPVRDTVAKLTTMISAKGMRLFAVIHQASRYSYGEATGITQTVRNYGASLGFAILGTVLINQFRSAITSSLTARGLPHAAASAPASKIAQRQGGQGNVAAIPPAFIRADFTVATRDVLCGMAVIMAVATFVALRGLRRGVQEEPEAAGTRLSDRVIGEEPGTGLGTAWS